MALVPIKTASETGYCDCICGCYELASLRDEDTGKGYCPACGKDHVDLNAGVGIPLPGFAGHRGIIEFTGFIIPHGPRAHS